MINSLQSCILRKPHNMSKALLLASAAAFYGMTNSITPAMAEGDFCIGFENKCQSDGTGSSETVAVQSSEEAEAAAIAEAISVEDEGYSISVDGEVVAGTKTAEVETSDADVNLNKADIQVKYDGLDVRPSLNVSTVPSKGTYEIDETLEFAIALNYGHWIARADIRITMHDNGSELIAKLPVDNTGHARWTVPEGVSGNLSYVLRVYDGEGRFDETQPRMLRPRDMNWSANAEDFFGQSDLPQKSAPDLNEDHTATRNIPVYGGGVTVIGQGIDAKSQMFAFGERVPVDSDGRFAIQRILPPGDHVVDVEVYDHQKNSLDFTRQVNIPDNDWFYVGLADLTLGKRFAKDSVKVANPDEYKGVYNKGRLAFYLKGKIQGRTILTAALDTTEDSFKNLLKNLDAKDPRQFLKRIDPDDYYPVYGDDSKTIEDAPTSGRFYVRLARDDSHVMWGNFKAYVNGNKFLRNERALYGAQGVYRSTDAALDGGRKTEVSVHAASPGTLTQQDRLRGTGGSAYFTQFQDVNKGSETVSIEVRDPVTDFVSSKTILKPGVDYDFDYSQGVVLLNNPLPSNSAGKPVYLVVSYEYTPANTDVKGYVFGGRAQQWLGDHVRVGVTGMRDNSGSANLDLAGGDVRLHASDNTYLELHSARSEGRGFGHSVSADGGLTFSKAGVTSVPSSGAAMAFGAQAHADLEELTGGWLQGDVGFEYSYKGSGFATLETETPSAREDIRLTGGVVLTEQMRVKAAASQSTTKGQKPEREVTAAIIRDIGEKTELEFSTKHSLKPGEITSPEAGQRNDLGARLTHQFDEDTKAYVYGQTTVHRSGSRKRDDRVGVGGVMPLSEMVSIEGEASYGSYGPGGQARLAYTPTADGKYYIGYALDPYRDLDPNSSFISSGTDMGAIIFGMRQRVNEQLSLYAEDSYDMFGLRKTLTQIYGVEYTPLPEWSITGALEFGNISDDTINAISGLPNSDFERKAGSLNVAYKNDRGDLIGVKGEARFERSDDHTRDMNSYLLQLHGSYKFHDDWRMLVNADVVLSDATATARDGEYIETSLAYAYRPADNDQLNALFKYTYLYDLPGADQVTVNGTLNGAQQRSHILTADAIFDLLPVLSIGAKYGVRIGETRARSGGGGWSESSAHLGVLRADFNIDSEWDALLEGRLLWSPTAGSSNFGALAALYRHLGESMKVGVGYNFGSFSDDLRDLTMDDHGVFMNAVMEF